FHSAPHNSAFSIDRIFCQHRATVGMSQALSISPLRLSRERNSETEGTFQQRARTRITQSCVVWGQLSQVRSIGWAKFAFAQLWHVGPRSRTSASAPSRW